MTDSEKNLSNDVPDGESRPQRQGSGPGSPRHLSQTVGRDDVDASLEAPKVRARTPLKARAAAAPAAGWYPDPNAGGSGGKQHALLGRQHMDPPDQRRADRGQHDASKPGREEGNPSPASFKARSRGDFASSHRTTTKSSSWKASRSTTPFTPSSRSFRAGCGASFGSSWPSPAAKRGR